VTPIPSPKYAILLGFLILSLLGRSAWLMVVGIVLFATLEIVALLRVRAREKKTFEARLWFTVSIWIIGPLDLGICLWAIYYALWLGGYAW